MFGHPVELIIVLILALIVFGPEKLPEVAATAGRFVRELRESVAAASNPEEPTLPDDFSTYYYDSMKRSGEPEVEVEEMPDPADEGVDFSHTGNEDLLDRPMTFHPEADTLSSNAFDDDDLDPAATLPATEQGLSDDREYHP
jgi:TatA/E family protein of Tat protein translocase